MNMVGSMGNDLYNFTSSFASFVARSFTPDFSWSVSERKSIAWAGIAAITAAVALNAFGFLSTNQALFIAGLGASTLFGAITAIPAFVAIPVAITASFVAISIIISIGNIDPKQVHFVYTL